VLFSRTQPEEDPQGPGKDRSKHRQQAPIQQGESPSHPAQVGIELELLKDDFEKIRPEVEVKQIRIPGGEETYILCRTMGRKEKEKAIRSRFVAKIEKALAGLEKRIVEGKLKDRDKMLLRLGRIQASHPQVADL
jgi:transposase